MSARERGRKIVIVTPWEKSYSESIEVDVAKIVGIIALFAFALICTARGIGQSAPASDLHFIWRYLHTLLESGPSL